MVQSKAVQDAIETTAPEITASISVIHSVSSHWLPCYDEKQPAQINDFLLNSTTKQQSQSKRPINAETLRIPSGERRGA
jgi:hypothetical protein